MGSAEGEGVLMAHGPYIRPAEAAHAYKLRRPPYRLSWRAIGRVMNRDDKAVKRAVARALETIKVFRESARQ
jgi:hypothetical protein